MKHSIQIFAIWLLAGIMGTGCAEDSDDSSVSAETMAEVNQKLNSFQTNINTQAASLCGISPEDATSTDDACYLELSVSFSKCQREGLATASTELDALLKCWQTDNTALTDCCADTDGHCSYSTIESCYATLWGGDTFSGDCELPNDAEIQNTIQNCEQNNTDASGSCGQAEGDTNCSPGGKEESQ